MHRTSLLLTLLSLINITLTLPPPITPDSSLEPVSQLNALNKRDPMLNCDGSFYCTIYTGSFISHAYRLATIGLPHRPSLSPTLWNLGPMNDTAFYATGHHALCLPNNDMMRTGFCVFAQYGDEVRRGVTGREVKESLKRLVEGGCEMCGSVRRREGGLVTVNYVDMGACGGICAEARFS